MKNKQQETITLKKNGLNLSYSNLRKCKLAIEAVKHVNREKIVNLLQENDLLTLKEISLKLNLKEPVVNKHLTLLCSAKIVLSREGGYCIKIESLSKIDKLVGNLVG